MTVSWTKHRFSGGLLILDATNTVVLRGDRLRSFDRFEDRAEMARFADAAAGFRSAELGGRRLFFQASDETARQDLPQLPLAVRRPQPQFKPPLVRHVGLRQPPQGEAALRTPQGNREGDRPCLTDPSRDHFLS